MKLLVEPLEGAPYTDGGSGGTRRLSTCFGQSSPCCKLRSRVFFPHSSCMFSKKFIHATTGRLTLILDS
jgi:hypothetical protein